MFYCVFTSPVSTFSSLPIKFIVFPFFFLFNSSFVFTSLVPQETICKLHTEYIMSSRYMHGMAKKYSMPGMMQVNSIGCKQAAKMKLKNKTIFESKILGELKVRDITVTLKSQPARKSHEANRCRPFSFAMLFRQSQPSLIKRIKLQ